MMDTALFLAGCAIMIAPWMARNYIETGAFKLSSIAAYNALFYNIAQFEAGRSGEDMGVVQEKLAAEIGKNSAQAHSLRSDAAVSRAVKAHIIADPVGYSAFHLRSLPTFFFASGFKTAYSGYAGLFPSTSASPIPWSLSSSFLDLVGRGESLIWVALTALALLSLTICRYRRSTILVAVVIAYFALVTGPVAYPRYRLPIEPLLFILAGVAIVQAARALRGRRAGEPIRALMMRFVGGP